MPRFSLPHGDRVGKWVSITLSGRVTWRARHSLASALTALFVGGSTAVAQDGSVYSTDEVTLRLVADPPAADGSMRGAIVIDLAPGWKTYWQDPGDAGLAPRVSIAGDGMAETPEIRLPAPVRFEEGGARSNGYVMPVGFGFNARVDGDTNLSANVAIGVCRTVCIPVIADLTLPIAHGAGAKRDPLVAWTFDALPDLEADAFDATLVDDGETLEVELNRRTSSKAADLFAAGPAGWSFGTPLKVGDDRFRFPVLAHPPVTPSEPLSVTLVLVDGETAIESPSTLVDIE